MYVPIKGRSPEATPCGWRGGGPAINHNNNNIKGRVRALAPAPGCFPPLVPLSPFASERGTGLSPLAGGCPCLSPLDGGCPWLSPLAGSCRLSMVVSPRWGLHAVHGCLPWLGAARCPHEVCWEDVDQRSGQSIDIDRPESWIDQRSGQTIDIDRPESWIDQRYG